MHGGLVDKAGIVAFKLLGAGVPRSEEICAVEPIATQDSQDQNMVLAFG